MIYSNPWNTPEIKFLEKIFSKKVDFGHCKTDENEQMEI